MKVKDYLENYWDGEELTLSFVGNFGLTHRLDIYSAQQWFCEEQQLDYTQNGSRVVNHQKTLLESDIEDRDMTFKDYMIKVYGEYNIKE